ncbi:restriction endonuclease subunit S [Psychrobacter pacificensis]|uniref:restriction endonuclease subunit S n=1 Tax=Psychrobacter pacificensis TaxID=112002 RepID=UPI003CFD473D
MAEKYLAYPEYKGSDVGWLKQVPKHWKKITFKYLLEMIVDNRGRTPPTYDVGIPLLEAKQIDGSLKYTGTSFDKFINEAGHSGFIRNDVKENDILFITVGTIGKTCLVPNQPDFVIAQNLVALRMIDNYSPVFMLYWLRSMAARESMLATNKDSILDSIKISDFIQSRLYIPELYEQTQIANFLDHETAQIDTLIDKQQTLIQLLKEKRQAVISHAVTKGLNPDAPMKDSGVEWLGDVPEHWEVVQAKYIADITRGAILRPVDAPEYFDENGEWSYLNISDATKCDKYLYESKLRLSPLGSKKSARVYPNNLIITASATIGKAFINKVKVCVHDGFIPFCNIKVDINYLYHYVSNPYLYAAMGKSNTQKNIYLDEVKNMIVTVPSRKEQEKIVEHIEKNQNEYSKLIDKAQQQIQLMQERRTALISAAVTGKIDVRGWRASE